MQSHVIPRCSAMTHRIPIKLQLPGKSGLIFNFVVKVKSFANSDRSLEGKIYLKRKTCCVGACMVAWQKPYSWNIKNLPIFL